MEVVNSFNGELNSLMDCKPPVSKAKMTSVTKAAIKAVKFYKHVVQGVEKFIQKCKPEFKVPGLYVIDSIVRQSRHQFGADKDVFTTRFSRNFDITFQNLFKCPPEEKSKIVRVLNLWQKNNVFAAEVIQPLLDMANPNHAINLQSAAATADDEQEELPPTKQQDTSSGGWLGWSTDGNSGETDGDLALKAVTQLLQQTQEASVASLLQASGQQLTQSLAENSLMLQLQQLSNALTQQSTTSIHYKPAEQEGTVKFNKKLLDFDYSDEDDDDDKKDDEVPHQQTQENSLAVSMAQNLLSNPDLLRQLQQMQQTIQQTEVLKTELDLQEHMSKQRLWQADELATQSLASGVPSQTTVTYQTTQPLQQTMTTTMTTLQPPPAFDLGSFPSILAPPPQLSGLTLSALGGAIGMSPSMPSMAPPSFLPIPPLTMDSPPINVPAPSVPTIDSPVVPIEPLPPVETYPVIDLDDSSLPENDCQEDSEVEEDKQNEREVERKSPPRRKERSRSRSRSKKRTLRRSRSRSPKRVRRSSRSRSGSRSRIRHKRDRRSRSKEREREREREREKEKEKEKEREKERKKRGLPPFKKDHLGVCSTTLWLGHVSKLVSEEDLADAFGEFGDIVQIDLIPPRGCAFVLMNRRQDAYRALQKLKNIKLQGKSITMAWAPGKGVKGKIYKDYWDAELGVSYIPYEKLPDDVDLDALEEGGMVDEETMPASLKEKQKTGKTTNAKVASSKDEKQNSGGDALSKQLNVTDKPIVATEKKFSAMEAAVAAQSQPVVPSAIIPPMMPPQFSMPTMVPGMMPIGCPPPIMPIMSSVNQQSMMPVMGGMPPPYAIPPVATVTPTSVATETSQIKEQVSEGTPMEELLAESPVVASADFLTSIDVRTRPASLDSPTVVSTPSAIETIVGGSCSIPLPPGSAPSMCVSTVTSSNTLVAPPTMTSAVNVMPPSHTGMAMPPFQQFMPPPHMFRPPGFPMMPPMGMNMTHMPPPVMPGGPVMNNVSLPPPPPPPSQSMMNASNMTMPGGPRMNNMPPMQPPPPPPSGMLLNMRPGMQGMRPPMMPPTFNPDLNRMGPGIASSWPNSGQSGQSVNLQQQQQKHNTTDVDMRGAPRLGGSFNIRPMMPNNVPFRNTDMQMNARMRAPSPSMSSMARQQHQQHQQPDSGPPSSVSRTSANTEALGTSLSRSISGERQSDVDRQTTPIEARLSRIAEMSNLESSSQRPPRGLNDRDGPMRPGNMIPGEGGLQQPGSIIGMFPGPRMDGPSHRMPVPTPIVTASQRMIRPNLGAPGFNRFPGLHKEVGPVFPGGVVGPRFPPVAGIPPRGSANFLDDEGGDYDMRFTMRQNFGGNRGRFVERDDRRFRPDEQLNNGGDRFEENFMWNRQQPPRLPESFRERDDRWNRDRGERDFEPDFERDSERDFRGRFRPDQMRDSRIDERPAWRGMPPQSLPLRDGMDFRRDDDRNRASRERMNRDRNREFRRDKERSRDRSIVGRSPGRETTANMEGTGLQTAEDVSVKPEPDVSKFKVELKAEPSSVKEESADATMDIAVKSELIIKTETSEASVDTVQNGIKSESA